MTLASQRHDTADALHIKSFRQPQEVAEGRPVVLTLVGQVKQTELRTTLGEGHRHFPPVPTSLSVKTKLFLHVQTPLVRVPSKLGSVEALQVKHAPLGVMKELTVESQMQLNVVNPSQT